MKIAPPSDSQLTFAISLLSDPDQDRESVIASLQESASVDYLAMRLADWIPECFAMTVVAHVASVRMDQYFQAKTGSGVWKSIPLRIEPIVARALAISSALFHSEDNDSHKTVASRSATLNAMENLLEQGGDPAGSVVSGPTLLSVPAEIYKPALPWWIRMHWR